jgi:hypothetical protein
MHIATVKYGDLCIEWDDKGNMQFTRQSDMQAIRLSASEWVFLLKVAELRGWPVAPPGSEGVQQ